MKDQEGKIKLEKEEMDTSGEALIEEQEVKTELEKEGVGVVAGTSTVNDRLYAIRPILKGDGGKRYHQSTKTPEQGPTTCLLLSAQCLWKEP